MTATNFTRRALLLTLSLLPLVACKSTDPRNSTFAAENPVAEMSSEEMQQQMMELASPGPEHALLARLVGTWDVKMQHRFDPNGEWMDSPATVVARTILDGRFVVEDWSSTMMGMPFSGYAMLGYDKLEKCYTALWADSFSTWTVISKGRAIKEGVTEFRGMMTDFATPKGRPFRSVDTTVDDDHWTSEMFDTIEGKEVPVMRIEAVRRR